MKSRIFTGLIMSAIFLYRCRRFNPDNVRVMIVRHRDAGKRLLFDSKSVNSYKVGKFLRF